MLNEHVVPSQNYLCLKTPSLNVFKGSFGFHVPGVHRLVAKSGLESTDLGQEKAIKVPPQHLPC